MTVSRKATWSLRVVALLYLTVLLLLPLVVVFGKTFEHGFSYAWGWMTTRCSLHQYCSGQRPR